MDWTEVIITVPADVVAQAGDIAQMVVPYGIYIEDYAHLEEETLEIAHVDLIDEALLARDRTKGLIHIYLEPEENPAEALAFLQERYTATGIAHTIETAQVREQDWANAWKEHFHPLPVGNTLLIQPTWEPVPGDYAQRKVLRIDPGMAFGTGGHATTKLCLEVLERTLNPRDAVLDVGCGSGILSIAACLLGAERVVGVDIDGVAVRTARENGRLNELTAPSYTILQGDLTQAVSGRFDLVVANIIADVICVLSRDIGAFLKPGGRFVMSGIIDTREADVVQALERAGFALTARVSEEGWVCLVAEQS